jgi:hypothetical protein
MTTLPFEFLSPHDFAEHPDNRPGGLKEEHIENLARNMREVGFRRGHPIAYCIADATWPAEYSALVGKRVLLGGHHRTKAAKLANIDKVPAILEQMTYEQTLKFLDDDNEASPLHWYERILLHEKRRRVIGMSSRDYGHHVLKYALKGSRAHNNNHYAVALAPTANALLAAGFSQNELTHVSADCAYAIISKSPQADWRGLITDMREGVLPTNVVKIRSILKARYGTPSTPAATPTANDTSYLYIAASPHTSLVKCGMTAGDDPVKYVAEKARGTWVLPGFVCEYFIDIPTVHIQKADAAMRQRFEAGWPAGKEFYTASVQQAKKVLKEIAAHFADPDDDVEDSDETTESED